MNGNNSNEEEEEETENLEDIDDENENIESYNRDSKIGLVLVGLVAFIPYCAVLNAPHVYDDEPAVLHNPDVQGNNPIANLWMNDFWGAPMLLKGSHKSYRPLTTLLYRFFHFLWGNWTFPLHFLNNALHAAVSILFYKYCQKVVFIDFSSSVHLVSGLLFALHPIHTEAVCPIVGCAETLSALCFMVSLLLISQTDDDNDEKKAFAEENQAEEIQESHQDEAKVLQERFNDQDGLRLRKISHRTRGVSTRLSNERPESENNCDDDETKTDGDDATVDGDDLMIEMNSVSWMKIFYILSIATHGMLFKETGVTVLGVIVIQLLLQRASSLPRRRSFFSVVDFSLAAKLSVILAWHEYNDVVFERQSFLLLLFRMWIMNWKSPSFDRVTNPTVFERDPLTRGLTYLYLTWFNFWLLLCPTKLSYDYSKCSIPLVTSCWDPRNIASISFISTCIAMPVIALFHLRTKTRDFKIFLLGFILMVVPFLPAANIFFPVGFVIAERILYLPSAGFVILIVLLWQKALYHLPSCSKCFNFAIATILSFYFIQTVTRTFVWTSNDNLLGSSLYAYPKNGKMNYNWGTRLQQQNRLKEALVAYDTALKCIPTDHGSLVNSGIVLEKLGSSDVDRIFEFYKKGIDSQQSNGLGYALQASLLTRMQRFEEAATVLTKAVGLLKSRQVNSVEAARLLVENWRTAQAKSVYFRLLKSACETSFHFQQLKDCSLSLQTLIENEVPEFQKKGDRRKASYLKSLIPKLKAVDAATLEIFRNSFSNVWSIEDALSAMLSHIEEPQKVDTKAKAASRFVRDDIWEKAIELFKIQRFEESKKHYETYIQLNPENYEASGQYAALLFQFGQPIKGERLLQEITEQDENCQSSGAWHNLATIYGRQFKFKKSISLLQNCLSKLSKYTEAELAPYKQKVAAIYCQLGKHQQHHSMHLNKYGQKKDARNYLEEAKKNLNTAIKMDPSNAEAHGTLLEIAAIQ